jgi:hypothetical protein
MDVLDRLELRRFGFDENEMPEAPTRCLNPSLVESG